MQRLGMPRGWSAELTRDEMRVVKDLAWMVLKSKQNVGRRLLDTAESVRKIIEEKERHADGTHAPRKEKL